MFGNSADELRMPRICCLFSCWISSRFSACGACLHYYQMFCGLGVALHAILNRSISLHNSAL